MKTLFLNIFAFTTLLCGVFAITAKNPVSSVIFLIATFVQAALYLILEGLNFIGISYIVIYVGAIAVLFLFVIMMINIKDTDILETGNQFTKNIPLALAIGFLFLNIFFLLIPNLDKGLIIINELYSYFLLIVKIISLNLFNNDGFNINFTDSLYIIKDQSYSFISSELTDVNFYLQTIETFISKIEQIQSLGHVLYTYDAVLLITLSIILLLAMFATIVISRNKK